MRVQVGILSLVVLLTGAVSAARADWPREMQAGEGRILMYQPQVGKFDGTVLEARTAVSVNLEGEEPVFGAVWIECLVDTDRDTRTVTVLDHSVNREFVLGARPRGSAVLTPDLGMVDV